MKEEVKGSKKRDVLYREFRFVNPLLIPLTLGPVTSSSKVRGGNADKGLRGSEFPIKKA